ncbi:ABC transporter substrate-binding protein [Pelagibius sp. CAU 1746]|uniref:ABC transporter substrate-binding protein n=1 Tax=Pelagibius sp. CAU 1746 TaxID=3140370 RepID=UPI00325B5DFD
MRRHVTRTLAAAALAIGAFAVAAPLSVPALAADVLRIGRDEDSTTLDPIKTTQNVDIWVINNVHAFLVRSNREGNDIEADLAESWTVSDDKLTFTFKLREAKFSDGSPVTVGDVVFSLTRLRDNEESTQRSLFQVMESIEAIDDRHVAVTLSQPSAAFLSTLAMYAASILPESAVTNLGDDFGAQPVSAGAYRVAEWRRGEYLALEPNPHYYGGNQSKVDRVEWHVVPDDNTRVLQVQAGELEVALGVPFSMLPSIERDPNIQVHLDPSTREDSLLLNHENKLLANRDVRLAVDMAINEQAIVQVVTFGRGEVANSLVPKGTLYYHAANKNHPNDVATAAKLIEDAGFKGETLEFVVPAGNEVREQTAIIVQEQLKAIGLDVDIRKVDPGQVWSTFVDGDYDLSMAYWTYDILDPDQKVAFSVSADDNKSYFTRYENPEVTKLVNEARTELDAEKRRDLYYRIQEKVKEDVHWVDLYYSPFSNITRKGVSGFYQNPMGVIPLQEISIN